MEHGKERVVIAALVVNVAIAIGKFVAAFFSRSSAMLAEACHSLADSANQIFLLTGMRRSTREADSEHPFGYGSETYFWSFIVALCIFCVGGGISVYEGIGKIVHRHDPGEALGDPRWAFGMLGLSVVLESGSLFLAMREFTEIRAGRSIARTLKEARDPTVVTVLFEDLAALFGLFVAIGGVYLSWRTGSLVYDGAASIVVGVALVGVATVLARDAKALLIGRSASPTDQATIAEVVRAHPDVLALVHARTMHMGPTEVILALKVQFVPHMTVGALEVRINELEAKLRAAVPTLRRIYVEPGFDERRA
ncbi:MAG: cation diffusion facilitator family transporter [Polyangia bacterium]